MSELEIKLQQVTRQRDRAWEILDKILFLLSFTRLTKKQKPVVVEAELEFRLQIYQQDFLPSPQISEAEQNDKLINPPHRRRLFAFGL